MNNIKQVPIVGNIITLLDAYPRISAWVVLSLGIVALLVYEARDVGLSAGNWIALIVASIVVAGLCIWIVSWEDEDEEPALRVTSEVRSVEPSPVVLPDAEAPTTAAPPSAVVFDEVPVEEPPQDEPSKPEDETTA
jgi:hypothetical protein